MSQSLNDPRDSRDEERPNLEDSGNLYEDWLKSCSNDSPDRAPSIQTIVVNSVAQSYQGLFQNLVIEGVSESREKLKENLSSNATSPGMSFASPKEKFGSLLGLRDLNKTCHASILEQQQESDRDEELLKIYCGKCFKEVYPGVVMKMKDLNIWGSIKYFFESLKCCRMSMDLKEYHEYIYTCPVCGSLIMHRAII